MRSTLFLYLIFALSISLNCDKTESDAQEEAYCSGISRDQLSQNNTENDRSVNPPLEMGHVPDSVPEGMIYVPGGTTTIGSEEGMIYEKPVFTTEVEPFFMDKHPVTVGDFRSFVEATGYRTFSDKIGDGIVFDFAEGTWAIVPGVNWEYPMGKDQPPAPDDHPVTLLTYDDAEAYLEWVGKRLPTEIEWEHAARGITQRNNRYAWGNELKKDGKFLANTWNGTFPIENTEEDNFLLTAPVGHFGNTELGLTDMGGNVWEWTSSWFRSYADRDETFTPTAESEKVLRGGSFMCHASYCHGYRVSARSNTPPDNNMFHIGFRGVKSIQQNL